MTDHEKVAFECGFVKLFKYGKEEGPVPEFLVTCQHWRSLASRWHYWIRQREASQRCSPAFSQTQVDMEVLLQTQLAGPFLQRL